MTDTDLKLEFTIQRCPTDDQLKYALAYLEGELIIKIDEQVYFHEPGIMLVEFGIVLNKWLAKVKATDQAVPMEYFTMDHDAGEGAILTLKPVDNACYLIHSIWQKSACPRLMNEQELTVAATSFIEGLHTELGRRGLVGLVATLS
ncbi:hypothetical protein HNQ93_000100 [Hymenobacter luteus]|uniref:DUF7878 domain-containing protein n=2 Tax=Hymenobacter TaxID=89966 RepID=A0A7W9SXM7_9BACT|nr:MULTISPECIES: hypothetical protein [Hymenobacter]MBB4600420.1 hypothetical protein [Hymenobacter latericoloratus]MBB6057270.1 hypothetical protein [Hymenobacter luteus]